MAAPNAILFYRRRLLIRQKACNALKWIAATCFAAFSIALQAHGAEPVSGAWTHGEWAASDRILIGLKDNPELRSSSASGQSLPDQLGLPAGVRITAGGTAGRLVQKQNEPFSQNENLPKPPFHIVHLDGLLPVQEALSRLHSHPLLEYAEPDYIGSGGGAPVEPADPDYDRQWHHRTIESPDAWSMTRGDSSIVVAVLDTGLNPSLAEFSGRTVPGYDFVNNRTYAGDDHGHGTAVSAVIAANANNGELIAGVDWHCQIMPVKVLDSGNQGLYSWWANGIYFAVNNGARVINLSAGGASTSIVLASAITYAISKGVVFVTITHNDGTGTIRFPGRMAEVITVGATDRDDRRSSFSNWGSAIDLVAPGRDIYTITRTGSLISWMGTSFAAPQVTGVASLLLSLRPELNHESVRLLLRAAAEDRTGGSEDTPGFDFYYGAGRLNAADTLALAATRIDEVSGGPDGSVKLRWTMRPNASQKAPFTIEFSDRFDVWEPVNPAPRIVFSDGFATWTDYGSVDRPAPADASRRFYRIRIAE